MGERPDPQAHHRAFRGPDQALPGDARRDVGQRHQAERGRADRADVDGPEPAVEPVVEDQLDQDRRREVRDHHAEGDDHREPEAGAQLRALPDPAPQDGEGAPELLGDLEAVVVDRAHGAHRSPRAYAWMIAAYPGDEAISSSWEPVPRDAPPVEVDHAIGQPDRRQSVRDHDERGLQLLAERGEDLRLDRGVDRRRRVVEDQHPRLTHDRARERDALAFPSRQRVAALADDGLEPGGQRVHETVDRRDPRRSLDRVVVRPGVERDVLADRRGEQEALLEHDRDGAPERIRLRVPEVDPADPHGPGLRVRQPDEELCERGLASAGLAHDRDGFPRADPQGHAVQDPRAVEAVMQVLGRPARAGRRATAAGPPPGGR